MLPAVAYKYRLGNAALAEAPALAKAAGWWGAAQLTRCTCRPVTEHTGPSRPGCHRHCITASETTQLPQHFFFVKRQ